MSRKILKFTALIINIKIIDRNYNNQHVSIIYNFQYAYICYDDILATLQQLSESNGFFLIVYFEKVARSRIYRRLSENPDAYVTNFLKSLLNKGKKFKP